MSDAADPVLASVTRALIQRTPLSSIERDALQALPHACRTLAASHSLMREGDRPGAWCSFVLSGFALRQKVGGDGGRQTLSIQMAGDFLDLQHLFLEVADHDVRALSPLTVVDLPRERLRHLATEHAGIARALWTEGLVEASRFREWMLNVGRRDARGRLAHLLCELAVRMAAAGMAAPNGFQIPMTQEQLGDAVALTNVHVNRTLRSLQDDGLIRFERRVLTILDWDGLVRQGDFDPLYLHRPTPMGMATDPAR